MHKLKLKLLGFRNGILKAKGSDGQHFYLKVKGALPGKLGEVIDIEQRFTVGRMDKAWPELRDRFHETPNKHGVDTLHKAG